MYPSPTWGFFRRLMFNLFEKSRIKKVRDHQPAQTKDDACRRSLGEP